MGKDQMSESDDVLLDHEGNPADKKAEFELRRKVIGRVVKGVRFCSSEEYKFVTDNGAEVSKHGATLIMSFEDGVDLIVAVPETGGVEFFIVSQSGVIEGAASVKWKM
jgi:hypothetical protein